MKEQADPYGRGGYCIVVAMHGDDSKEAEVLRNFRDKHLKGNLIGEKIIDIYYSASPKVNRKIGNNNYTSSFISQTITSISETLRLLAV